MLARRILGGVPDFFDVESFNVSVERKFNSAGALYSASQAVVKIRIGEETLISAAEGNGPVNALDLALRKDLGVYQSRIEDLELLDYRVRVFQGGTDAVTRVLIEFGDAERRALVDGRRLRQHHRRLVPGARRRDQLQAGEVGGDGAVAMPRNKRANSLPVLASSHRPGPVPWMKPTRRLGVILTYPVIASEAKQSRSRRTARRGFGAAHAAPGLLRRKGSSQ